MTEMIEMIEKAQEDSLKAIKTQHEQALVMMRDLADTVRGYWESVDTDQFGLPDPRELVASYVAFNRALVDETRAFTDKAFEVWAPKPEKKAPVRKAS